MFTYSLKSRVNLERLIKLAKKYRIKQMYNEHEYLEKIDVIPVSLVLAQSAVESAWGSSRFAREGNNIFGEWTWGKRGSYLKAEIRMQSISFVYSIRLMTLLNGICLT